MGSNDNRELIVIVHLTKDLADKLNDNNVGGKNYGLECCCNGEVQEVNCNGEHGDPKRRIFFVKGVKNGDQCVFFMRDKSSKEKEIEKIIIAYVAFGIPKDREFEIVELGNPGKVLTEEILKLISK